MAAKIRSEVANQKIRKKRKIDRKKEKSKGYVE
jgi:hypothetical protein